MDVGSSLNFIIYCCAFHFKKHMNVKLHGKHTLGRLPLLTGIRNLQHVTNVSTGGHLLDLKKQLAAILVSALHLLPSFGGPRVLDNWQEIAEIDYFHGNKGCIEEVNYKTYAVLIKEK